MTVSSGWGLWLMGILHDRSSQPETGQARRQLSPSAMTLLDGSCAVMS